jgi:hypothetical protein
MNAAEKIETIVHCYLTNRTTQGTLGTIVDVPAYSNAACSFPACYRVECDGRTYIVRSTSIGWSVAFGPFIGEDRELYVAARMVCEETAGGNIASSLAEVLTLK